MRLSVAVAALAVAHAGDARRLRKKWGPGLYVHFHKAGGTSACAAMHAAGLRSGGGSNYNSGKSCDCTNWMGSSFKYMGHRGDAKAMARAMKDNGADVCMIEHGKGWPPPERFFGNKMRENWPGTLATMLRDPWSRFRSAFMRVHQLALAEGKNVSIEHFASEKGDTQDKVKSCFNRPNYYVRFLNGEGHCNFKFDYARVAMNRTHLDLAKRVLATFDYVFVAESNRTALEFGDYVGFEQAMPHLSNSAYSTHRTAHGAARAPPPVQHFMAEFYAQNRLDYELYLCASGRKSTSTRRWREAGPTREIRTPSTRHSLSPHRWALERHGLQAAYAPLVGPAVAFE